MGRLFLRIQLYGHICVNCGCFGSILAQPFSSPNGISRDSVCFSWTLYQKNNTETCFKIIITILFKSYFSINKSSNSCFPPGFCGYVKLPLQGPVGSGKSCSFPACEAALAFKERRRSAGLAVLAEPQGQIAFPMVESVSSRRNAFICIYI